ncbi:MAG: glycosyltransferase family 2 protein [Hyphomicrobiales bacterium]|nr:glycosyltransferase family 2 protein [Hyphomicrobiales bacterium]
MPSSDPVVLSIVLPAYNEADNVAPMISALKRVLTPMGCAEILFVDDGSTDGTLTALRIAAAGDSTVRYLAFTRNFGHEAALRAGLRQARGQAVVVMDADFEHPPELIPQFVEQWRAGCKVVAGRRTDGATVSRFKRATSRLYYRVLGALGDVQMEPGSADFLLLDRAVVDTINAFDTQDLFLRGFVRWLGYPIGKIDYRPGQRRHGASKYSLRRMVELALTGIAAHSVRPLRAAIWMALGFAALGLLFVVYSVVGYLFRHTVAGWTSIMAVIAILGAAQLFVLGIIGEYVGRILRETRRRPSYIVAETEADRRPAAGAVAPLATSTE